MCCTHPIPSMSRHSYVVAHIHIAPPGFRGDVDSESSPAADAAAGASTSGASLTLPISREAEAKLPHTLSILFETHPVCSLTDIRYAVSCASMLDRVLPHPGNVQSTPVGTCRCVGMVVCAPLASPHTCPPHSTYLSRLPERPPEASYVEAPDAQLHRAIMATKHYLHLGRVYTPVLVKSEVLNPIRTVILEVLQVCGWSRVLGAEWWWMGWRRKRADVAQLPACCVLCVTHVAAWRGGLWWRLDDSLC